ncbi:MAG TPA: hypothetical protein PKD90_05410 [Phnomibacter sp.]|nr:hypothetical protein [Phnomibacter sp.]
MHPNLLDILSHAQEPVSSQQLVAYLTGQLNPADSHEVERKLAASPIGNDALHGLMHFSQKEKLPDIEQALNEQLRKQLQPKPKKRRKPLGLPWWQLITLIALLLALCVGVWFAIHFLHR